MLREEWRKGQALRPSMQKILGLNPSISYWKISCNRARVETAFPWELGEPPQATADPTELHGPMSKSIHMFWICLIESHSVWCTYILSDSILSIIYAPCLQGFMSVECNLLKLAQKYTKAIQTKNTTTSFNSLIPTHSLPNRKPFASHLVLLASSREGWECLCSTLYA